MFLTSVDIEEIKKFLPQYLSDKNEKELFSQLKDFPNNMHKMYTSKSFEAESILQADVFKDVPIVNLPNNEVKEGKVLIVSNSCDNDITNSRNIPISIAYVPILKLDAIKSLLEQNNIAKEKIDSFIQNVKSQKITNYLYLPRGTIFEEDLMACFDKPLNMSSKKLYELVIQKENKKLSTMSNYGFYIFLLKLSIHFTRIKEQIDRDKIN
jgi:hypothetical protein